MRQVVECYRAQPTAQLVVFAIANDIDGLYAEEWLEKNILLVKVRPSLARNGNNAGHWVAISNVFADMAERYLRQSAVKGSPIRQPGYIEFPDGFGVGYTTIQRKLTLSPCLKDIPIIVTAHTPIYFIDRLNRQPLFKLPTYWYKKMEQWCLIAADGIVSPSQALIDELTLDLKQPLAPHRVIFNPYQIPDTPLEKHSRVKRDHFYIASRLTYWKGIEQAIKGMKILWDDGSTVALKVYGSDTLDQVSGSSYQEFLQKRYKGYIDLGLLQFEGLRTRDHIDMASSTAYAQLHPSLFDNLPYSLIEAMAVGRICIAGKRGGIGEIAEDGDGILLCDTANPDDIANSLRKVMLMNERQRREIGENARRSVREKCSMSGFITAKNQFASSLHPTKTRTLFPFSVPSKHRHELPDSRTHNALLSVAIPYFNMHEFIDETVASIAATNYPNWEIILVNDGSTAPKAIEKLSSLHERHGLTSEQLKIFNIPNGGVANARNFGSSQANGTYFSLLDADDIVSPDYYPSAINILESYENVSFVGCWIEDFNEKGRIRDWITSNAEPPLQLVMNQTNCQSLVYRRKVYVEDGQHDPDLHMFLDDWEGVIKLLDAGHLGVMIPRPLFQYRIRTDSIFRMKANLWDLNLEKLATKHPAIFNEWGSELVAFLNANGPSNMYHIAGRPSGFSR